MIMTDSTKKLYSVPPTVEHHNIAPSMLTEDDRNLAIAILARMPEYAWATPDEICLLAHKTNKALTRINENFYTVEEFVGNFRHWRKMPQRLWPAYETYIKAYCNNRNIAMQSITIVDNPWGRLTRYPESAIRETFWRWLATTQE